MNSVKIWNKINQNYVYLCKKNSVLKPHIKRCIFKSHLYISDIYSLRDINVLYWTPVLLQKSDSVPSRFHCEDNLILHFIIVISSHLEQPPGAFICLRRLSNSFYRVVIGCVRTCDKFIWTRELPRLTTLIKQPFSARLSVMKQKSCYERFELRRQ